MTPPAPITSARLTLIPATVDLLRADATDQARLSRLLRAAIPKSWPQPLWGGALQVVDRWLMADDVAMGWGPWYCLLRDPPTLVGTVGLKGRPDASGTVEIGYGMAEEHQRQGYAPEATEALVGWAFQHSALRIIAHTFERHTPSVRVLEKCGFRFVGPGFEKVDEAERGDLGELILFERTR